MTYKPSSPTTLIKSKKNQMTHKPSPNNNKKKDLHTFHGIYAVEAGKKISETMVRMTI